MNAKNSAVRKPLPSYCVWYRAALVIVAVIVAFYLVLIAGWFTGHTLEYFYGVDGLLLEHAMETPDLILYMPTFGIICFAIMALLGVLTIVSARKEKEYSFDRVRQYMGLVIISFWTVPVYHAVADLALTAFEYRSLIGFDVFDMGLNIWPCLITTVVGFVILLVNGKLGEIPTGQEIY